jgi:F-type H+-transporting ATPase subunit epsilon
MILEIITPEKTVFRSEVDLVRVPGQNGSFAMLHNHAPIVSALAPGLIKIVHQVKERYFQLYSNAIVEQHNNVITIIASKVEETFPIFVR